MSDTGVVVTSAPAMPSPSVRVDDSCVVDEVYQERECSPVEELSGSLSCVERCLPSISRETKETLLTISTGLAFMLASMWLNWYSWSLPTTDFTRAVLASLSSFCFAVPSATLSLVFVRVLFGRKMSTRVLGRFKKLQERLNTEHERERERDHAPSSDVVMSEDATSMTNDVISPHQHHLRQKEIQHVEPRTINQAQTKVPPHERPVIQAVEPGRSPKESVHETPSPFVGHQFSDEAKNPVLVSKGDNRRQSSSSSSSISMQELDGTSDEMCDLELGIQRTNNNVTYLSSHSRIMVQVPKRVSTASASSPSTSSQ